MCRTTDSDSVVHLFSGFITVHYMASKKSGFCKRVAFKCMEHFLTCGLQTCLLDVKYLFVYFPGFTGTNCEVNIDDCRNHQCQNGATCIDGIEEYTCRCTQHWKGR